MPAAVKTTTVAADRAALPAPADPEGHASPLTAS